MKNLTTNSTLRNLFPLAIIMVGLFLWISQGWAATIHSVAAGGDWNKAETWVGGQVPTEDDSVVVNGVVSVYYAEKTIGLTVSANGKIVNKNTNGNTLTVNGSIINNGTISNNENSVLYLRVSGNLTNNGKLDNHEIVFIEGSATRQVKANTSIESTDIHLNANIEIIGDATFTGRIKFNSKQLTINQPNVVTFGDAQGTGTIQGGGRLRLMGNANYLTVKGNAKEIIFDGQEQNINGEFTANNIIFGGSGKKISYYTTINGLLTVNKGIILLNKNTNGNTLTVNGSIINNGTISNNENSVLYIRVSGNILNNGTWNNYRTTLTFPSGEFRMTGTPTWEQPYRGSSYEITDYLTTQHHWQVSIDGGPWSEQRGINDPSFVALPTVPYEASKDEIDTSLDVASQTVAVIQILNDGTVKRISAMQAARKYDFFLDAISKNSAGNLRGMIIDAKSHNIYKISTKTGEVINDFGIAIDFAIELKNAGPDIKRILSSHEDNATKFSQLSSQMTGAAARTLAKMPVGTVKAIAWITRHTKWINPVYWEDKLLSYLWGRPSEFDKALDTIDSWMEEAEFTIDTRLDGDVIYQELNIVSDRLAEMMYVSINGSDTSDTQCSSAGGSNRRDNRQIINVPCLKVDRTVFSATLMLIPNDPIIEVSPSIETEMAHSRNCGTFYDDEILYLPCVNFDQTYWANLRLLETSPSIKFELIEYGVSEIP
jgi:hypothetical protein